VGLAITFDFMDDEQIAGNNPIPDGALRRHEILHFVPSKDDRGSVYRIQSNARLDSIEDDGQIACGFGPDPHRRR